MKISHCKKLIISSALLLTYGGILHAQVIDTSIKQSKNNILKLNIPALFFKNISLQYERKISAKNSLALSVRYRPNSTIPFKNAVEDIADDTLIKVDLFKIGNFGITPEYRFYLGKKGALHGFYIGPFISYNHYVGDVPINYNDYVNNRLVDKTATFKGSVNTFSFGFQLGAQWKLSDDIYLDWWILGPNYGVGNGDFNFVGSLNGFEQINMQYEIDKLKETLPIKVIKSRTVTENGASFKVEGPWAGIRAFGLNIGYRF
jgi:hypothetical protein